MPSTNNGGISPILKCANAKIKAETIMLQNIPKSFERVGNKMPRNTISSKKGAKIVVVINKIINDK